MALRLLDSFLAQGLDVYLLTLDRNVEIPIHSKRIIHLSQANVCWGTLRKVFMAPRQWLKLQQTLQRLHCQVLISFMERANILNMLTLGKLRRIISIRTHLSIALRNKSPIKRGLIRFFYPLLLRRTGVINFNSKQAAGDFRSLFAVDEKKISVIYNYCDRKSAQSLAKKPLPHDYETVFKNRVIITCGRLIRIKGHRFLIQAFKEVRKHHPETRLIILGDGPLKEQLVDLTRQLELDGTVFFPGYQANPFAWMARADLFVLPSLTEGFPNALLEAMTLGIPVISTDCPSGPREMLSNKDHFGEKITKTYYSPHGILIPRLDRNSKSNVSLPESSLTSAIMKLLEDDKLRRRYGQAAQERTKMFSSEHCLYQWRSLIRC
ncbi:glycosyltransferase [Candidatus Pacearchaeota archaeon]|nr:glycosyltransferase [Candidatus Pacearchaeota archaeon]